MTTVVNKYKSDYDVYIGRGSKWGNPFHIGPDGNRADVIHKCKEWLLGHIPAPDNSIPPSLEDVKRELTGKVLGCFCAPLACHGDIYVELCEASE